MTVATDNFNNWRNRPDSEKLQFLQTVSAKDAAEPEVQALAENLWQVACASRFPKWAFVELAQCVARDLIRYVTDHERVGREQIDGWTDPYISPLAPLERGTDDCDAKARLFVALCLARQISAKVMPRPTETEVKAGRPLTHVWALVWVGLPIYDKTTKTLTQGAQNWVPIETILARAKVNEQAEHIPHERDTGNWLYS
jgi:transglutaminase-like putative cysteine protease